MGICFVTSPSEAETQKVAGAEREDVCADETQARHVETKANAVPIGQTSGNTPHL